MKEITIGLRKSLGYFLANYNLADITSATPFYEIADFDPANADHWKLLNKVTDYGFVIHGMQASNEGEHPYSHHKIRFKCDITIARNTTKIYDVTNRLYYPVEGTTGMTSLLSVATNLQKWLRDSKLDEVSGTQEVYWADVRSISEVKEYTGNFCVTLSYEALRMETKTITYS